MKASRRRWSEMNKDRIALAQLVASYQLFNRASGKSATTVNWYEDRLGMFLKHLGENAILADLTADAARSYIIHLQERTDRCAGNPFVAQPNGQLSSAYIHGCVRAVRAFASWLYAEEYTDSNRLRAVRPPKVQRKVVPVLKDDEVEALLAVFDRGDAFGVRNHAMVYTLLDTGLRASELCGLRLDDLRLREGYFKVLGKGNKERLVPFGTATEAVLSRYRDHFRPLFEPSALNGYLFINANGEPITVNALQEMLQRAARRAQLPRVTCHLLRHTFATNYLVREVGDPMRLQQMLGHSSLEMVRHYVQRASVQQNLLERRPSPMDLLAGSSANSRHLQPRRPVGGRGGEARRGRVSPRV
jgi:site-specific recombinase XerD